MVTAKFRTSHEILGENMRFRDFQVFQSNFEFKVILEFQKAMETLHTDTSLHTILTATSLGAFFTDTFLDAFLTNVFNCTRFKHI